MPAPGRCVGPEVVIEVVIKEGDAGPFEETMQRLVAQLDEQKAEAASLGAAIAGSPEERGYVGS
ncbi:type I restriction endonuclease subunit M [Tepidiforma thermophila]|uniref:type I restriction endonuclease subunit M n=1 Tax=Tepidiforma thermophila (strain KCTC 52669 / CGMCC 1.13589 / G233) TaxID=2761530 RepID=UPI0013FDB439|nr:type I restriction endonuclease subunit M [Tepidiforma thermophila]